MNNWSLGLLFLSLGILCWILVGIFLSAISKNFPVSYHFVFLLCLLALIFGVFGPLHFWLISAILKKRSSK